MTNFEYKQEENVCGQAKDFVQNYSKHLKIIMQSIDVTAFYILWRVYAT